MDARHAKGVLIGDHGVQHNHYAGRATVSWPHRVGVVPLLADRRLDRPADRHLAAMAGPGADAVVVCQVLAGLGGVGKTQLAAALAERLWREREVDLLVWVTATSRTSIVIRYAEAAAEVTGVEVTGVDDPGPELGAARLLAWLAATGRRWLVVLDDLTDPNDMAGLWPPTTAAGRTVVTTRRRDTALLAGRLLIDVDLFTPDEAARYLRDKLGEQPGRLDQADGLAADLGYLPLALAQAAAYIGDQGLTCAGYRQRLVRRRLADLAPHALPDEQRATVAATLALSVDLADTLPPAGLARPVIELAALLDPNAIPTALFATTAVTGYCAARLGRQVDSDDTHDALRLLHRLNLATIDEATSTVRVHGLVQRAVRETTPADQARPLAVVAADALLELWPDIERDSAHAHLLRANTTALDTTGPHLWSEQDGGHPVLFQAGHSLATTGLVGAAADYFTHLHTTAEHHLGPRHPDTLATRANRAHCQGQAGDPAGAAAAYEQLLTDVLRLVGQDHPDTLAVRHNIAFWRGEAGDPAGAVIAFEQLLADRLRVLGPDHPDTLAARGNLAHWHGEAGDPAGAATELEEVLADRLRVLGPDHPDTLITRAALAARRGMAGDSAGAATAYHQLLDEMVRILGPDHPHTLVARGDIAESRGQAGDPAGATAAYEQLLADMVRVLGPDHPFTLATRSNLVAWRGAAGDAAGAATALEHILTDLVRVLGPDHPDTLTARDNLAYWRGEAGDPAGAATELEEVLADRLRVLGPDHPATPNTRAHLAHWRARAQDNVRKRRQRS